MTAVQHLVVLMLENRSFDHMLGFLREPNTLYRPSDPLGRGHPDPSFDGLKGTEMNRADPMAPASAAFRVYRKADAKEPAQEPGHHFENVQRQLFGGAEAAVSPDNCGFVADYLACHGADRDGSDVMGCFTANGLPVLSRLALEFAICDRWFASVPGPAWPNRLFAHAGTSAGELANRARGSFARTIFERLTAGGKTWRVYHDGLPVTYAFPRLYGVHSRSRFRSMRRFTIDAARGDLANYTFIEPDHLGDDCTSGHPRGGVAGGERLIAEVYNAIRANEELWKRTLLVITWDNHGGFYDHVAPPAAVPPSPGLQAENGFGFDRLGPRVPAVIVSPYIDRARLDHTVYDHTSILKTAREIFGFQGSLGDREAAASSFLGLLTRKTPRTDAPRRLVARPTGSEDVGRPPSPTSLERALVSMGDQLLRIESGASPSEAAARAEAAVALAGELLRDPLALARFEARVEEVVRLASLLADHVVNEVP